MYPWSWFSGRLRRDRLDLGHQVGHHVPMVVVVVVVGDRLQTYPTCRGHRVGHRVPMVVVGGHPRTVPRLLGFDPLQGVEHQAHGNVPLCWDEDLQPPPQLGKQPSKLLPRRWHDRARRPPTMSTWCLRFLGDGRDRGHHVGHHVPMVVVVVSGHFRFRPFSQVMRPCGRGTVSGCGSSRLSLAPACSASLAVAATTYSSRSAVMLLLAAATSGAGTLGTAAGATAA